MVRARPLWGDRDDDYLPEDGILVVRDSGTGFGEDEMSAIDAHPCGTIVRTGQGWLCASGGDGPCVVRLQVHADRPGDEDVDAWADLVEVPYRSLAGAVELALLMTGSGDEDLHLGEPGLYAACCGSTVSRRISSSWCPSGAGGPTDRNMGWVASAAQRQRAIRRRWRSTTGFRSAARSGRPPTSFGEGCWPFVRRGQSAR
jgi:hypothetical protein